MKALVIFAILVLSGAALVAYIFAPAWIPQLRVPNAIAPWYGLSWVPLFCFAGLASYGVHAVAKS